MIKNILNFKLVLINYEYVNFLRKYDSKVTYNYGNKKKRPYLGVLIKVGDIDYFAPLSSPKAKHIGMKSNIDLIKIDEGKLGVVNLNNMIPVKSDNYEIIDTSVLPQEDNERKRIMLLRTQLYWLNKNKVSIIGKAKKLYNLYVNDLLPNRIAERCCNFVLLEKKCSEYKK